MNTLQHRWQQFWQEDDAVTAIEYALIAALVAAAIAGAVTLLGTNIGNVFTNLTALIP